MADLSDEQRSVLEKVEKLLRLAAKSTSEAEATNAAAKAQELLTAYNIDVAVLEQNNGGSAARENAALIGGAHKYQRDLWNEVAQLNFCLYWTVQDRQKITRKVRSFDGSLRTVNSSSRVWKHNVIGRRVNVAATKSLAQYLEGAIERLVQERLGVNQGKLLFSQYAMSYRKGAADRICIKLWSRREEKIAEEKKREAEAHRDGVSTATALTITHYIDKEQDANLDFLYGEGWSARRASERAKQAAAARAADEEYTRWAAEHPEEAAKEEAKRRKERERSSKRRRGARDPDYGNVDWSGYYAGYDAADSVSLDRQVDSSKHTRLLR